MNKPPANHPWRTARTNQLKLKEARYVGQVLHRRREYRIEHGIPTNIPKLSSVRNDKGQFAPYSPLTQPS